MDKTKPASEGWHAPSAAMHGSNQYDTSVMTPKQEERIRNKIRKIKAALAADKKFWGGEHHDGQGLRYAPPQLYLKLGDYTGGLRYINWFYKNFPDDSGFPDFLFECTVILFKTGRLKQAEKKAYETFTRNTYLFDKFFGKPIHKIDKYENSRLQSPEFAAEYFEYSARQEELSDFAAWLDKFTQAEKFITAAHTYIDIYKKLQHERDVETRGYLLRQARQLEDEL